LSCIQTSISFSNTLPILNHLPLTSLLYRESFSPIPHNAFIHRFDYISAVSRSSPKQTSSSPSQVILDPSPHCDFPASPKSNLRPLSSQRSYHLSSVVQPADQVCHSVPGSGLFSINLSQKPTSLVAPNFLLAPRTQHQNPGKSPLPFERISPIEIAPTLFEAVCVCAQAAPFVMHFSRLESCTDALDAFFGPWS
jgi:hypothetical protein